MEPERQRLSPAERANLVAYLDGELNEAESRAISTKLSLSLSARRELEALEKTWGLLDHLPRPATPPDFTSRTLSEIRRLAGRDERLLTVAGGAARQAGKLAVLTISVLVSVGMGYTAARWAWPDPTARLVRDLSLAEHFDEYLDVGSFQFLAQLDDSTDFKDEATTLRPARSRPGEEERQRRLRSISLEGRRMLEENLARFDLLDGAHQAAVRALDGQIARLSSTDRARYHSLLRRYHLWVQRLHPEQKQALESGDDAERLGLVTRYRKTGSQGKAARNGLQRAQFALLSPVSLFEAAYQIKVWRALKPPEQRTVAKIRDPRERKTHLEELGNSVGMPQEDPRAAWVATARRFLNANPRWKKEFDELKARRKTELAHRRAEARYFLENEPEPVAADRLFQFDAEMPPWIRDQLDPLPADAARRRLAILYRQVFPSGSEIPPAPTAEGEPRSKSSPSPVREPAVRPF